MVTPLQRVPHLERVAVVGASGYAGRELTGLLQRHPGLHLAGCFSARNEGGAGPPALHGAPAIQPLAELALPELDGLFLCTPHGVAAPLAANALEGACKVVDLSADLRLKDVALWERTYGIPHPRPALCDAAVYGLTEHARAEVRGARLVANPGCYPTAVLTGLLPLLEADLIAASGPIIADCKSGVSGAGKSPSGITLFGNVSENFRAYNIGAHRHTPEIHQAAETDRIVFVPHLLPCFRGILATLYLPPAQGVDADACRAALQQRYANEPFVEVLPTGSPELADVENSNRVHLGVAQAGSQIVVVAVIDNLVKGAAGQALQNMNLMLGLAETEGLA